MKRRMNRRQFLSRLAAVSLGTTGAAVLAACGNSPTPELMRIATTGPTAISPTASPIPASTMVAPTAVPTQAPTVVPPSASATQSAPPTPAATAAAPTATQLAPTQQPAQAPIESPVATKTQAPTEIPPTVTATQPPATATRPATPTRGPADLVAARGADPSEITRLAVAALGGIERFVKPGQTVVIKPNICNAYHGPEYASTTNPDVVGTLVGLCIGAGAGSVVVLDYPFGGTAQKAYTTSGIEAAVTAAGGEMEVIRRVKFRDLDIPGGRAVTKWPVYGTVLDADVLIDVPIAKDHGSTRLTLAMKNLMGIIENRNGFHSRGLHQCIADLSSAVRPHLTVVDAVRMLMANGPTGGNLNDVKLAQTVIASADIVAADAYAASLFGMDGSDIGYIRLGHEMGLGNMNLSELTVEEITA